MRSLSGLPGFAAVISSTAFALVIGAQGVFAQTGQPPMGQVQGQASGGQIPGGQMDQDALLKQAQEHMLKMHEMMHQIMLESDPQKKEALMAEQRNLMRQQRQQIMMQRPMMRGMSPGPTGRPTSPGMGMPPGATPMPPPAPAQPGTGTTPSGQTQGGSSQ